MANQSVSTYKGITITHHLKTDLYSIKQHGTGNYMWFSLEELKSFEFHLSTFLEEKSREEEEEPWKPNPDCKCPDCFMNKECTACEDFGCQ